MTPKDNIPEEKTQDNPQELFGVILQTDHEFECSDIPETLAIVQLILVMYSYKEYLIQGL